MTTQVRLYPDCFRCDRPFDLKEGEPTYIYCPSCREILRREVDARRVRLEVECMYWPDVIDA